MATLDISTPQAEVMMIKQQAVMDRLEYLGDISFNAYASKMQYIQSMGQALVGLGNAVEKYFSTTVAGVGEALEELVFYLYCDIQRRNIVREHNFNFGYATNYPAGYYDIRKCFYTFPMLEIAEPDFLMAWSFTTDPSTGEPVASNSYVSKWIADITSAPTDETSNIIALTNWCKDAGGKSNLIHLLENEGKVVSSLDTEDIARIIYEDRHLHEIIRERGYDIYVPSYLR